MFTREENLTPEQARTMNPIVLAFVGDAVMSLYVREQLVLGSDYKTGELQNLASARVSAKGQARQYAEIRDGLTEEEEAVFLRARNAKKSTRSKNASVAEYNLSTGFEAVIGYLYLTGQTERATELMGESDED